MDMFDVTNRNSSTDPNALCTVSKGMKWCLILQWNQIESCAAKQVTISQLWIKLSHNVMVKKALLFINNAAIHVNVHEFFMYLGYIKLKVDLNI